MVKAIKSVPLFTTASIRLCMGSRRGFICRMKMGNMEVNTMSASHTHRARQRNTLGPSPDGNHYTVVHVTGYIKNWPPSGKVIDLHTRYILRTAITDYRKNSQDSWRKFRVRSERELLLCSGRMASYCNVIFLGTQVLIRS